MRKTLALIALLLTTALTSAQVIIIDSTVVAAVGVAGNAFSDGVVSNITLNGTDLQITGTNGGFNGTVPLASLIGAGLGDGDYGDIIITGGVWGIEPGIIVTGDLADAIITTAKLATGSVTTDVIADGTIAGADIGALTIQAGNIADGQVTSVKFLDGDLLEVDLNATNVPTDNYILSYDQASGGFTWIPENPVIDGDKGDITVSGGGLTWDIDSGTVGSQEVADGTLTGTDIQDLTISGVDITNAAITPQKLGSANSAQDNYLLSKTPASESFTWVDPATFGGGGGITDGDKGDVVVSSSGAVWDLDSDVVTTVELADNAVNTANIINGTIDPIDLELLGQSLGAGLDGYVWTYDNAAGDFALVSRTDVANALLAANNTWSGNQTFDGTVDFANILGVEADIYSLDDGNGSTSASIDHNTNFINFQINNGVSNLGYQIRHGGPSIDTDLATKLYVDTEIAGVSGGGGDVLLAANQTFTGQNDFNQRIRTAGVNVLADGIPASSWGFQMVHNGQSSGLFNTSGNDGQLILRDDAGNVDINLLADGTSVFAGGITSAGSNVVTVGDTGTVSETMLATDAVTTAKISDSSVSLDKLQSNSVDGAKIVNGSINEADINAANNPTDEYVLTYEGDTGQFEWQAESAGSAGGITTDRQNSASVSYTPTTAEVSKVTLFTSDGTEVLVQVPTGVYSAGETICFQQGGTSKVRLAFAEPYFNEIVRSTGPLAAFCIDFDGTNWAPIGNIEFVDSQAPPIPVPVAGATTESSLTWDWPAVTDTGTTNAAASGVAEYEVSFDGGISQSVGTNLTYTETGLSASTTHNLRVKAIDAEGNESSFSSTVDNTTDSGAIVYMAGMAGTEGAGTGGEVNGIAGTVGDGDGTFSVETTEVNVGTYALRVTVSHGQTDVLGDSFIELQNVAIGDEIQISYDAFRGTSPNSFNCQPQLNDADGWDVTSSGGNVASGGWNSYVISATATQVNPRWRIRFTSSSDDGHFYLFDNIAVTKLN